jgi:hypothetical protein
MIAADGPHALLGPQIQALPDKRVVAGEIAKEHESIHVAKRSQRCRQRHVVAMDVS